MKWEWVMQPSGRVVFQAVGTANAEASKDMCQGVGRGGDRLRPPKKYIYLEDWALRVLQGPEVRMMRRIHPSLLRRRNQWDKRAKLNKSRENGFLGAKYQVFQGGDSDHFCINSSSKVRTENWLLEWATWRWMMTLVSTALLEWRDKIAHERMNGKKLETVCRL